MIDVLKEAAAAAGFSQTAQLNLSALVFMPEVREMCAADKCSHYGKNWRCPPACGSIEDAAEEAAKYSTGILVQTTGKMEDDFDWEAIERTMTEHKEKFRSLVSDLKETLGPEQILPMGAGTCTICNKCAYPDAPCRHPDEALSSMEAYGLWVSKVCELSEMPYNYGIRTITFTSCCLAGK